MVQERSQGSSSVMTNLMYPPFSGPPGTMLAYWMSPVPQAGSFLVSGLSVSVSLWSPSFHKMARDMWAVVPDAEKMLQIMLNTPECYAVQRAMQSPQRDFVVQIHRDNVEKSLTWQNFEQLWTAHPPTIDRLGEIETETLFIVGTDEKADVLRIAVLFEQVPNIRFVRIQDADHALTWTHPSEVVATVREFLAH